MAKACQKREEMARSISKLDFRENAVKSPVKFSFGYGKSYYVFVPVSLYYAWHIVILLQRFDRISIKMIEAKVPTTIN
jgi:hypothetical protein